MCGILGFIGEYDREKAESSLSKLDHRGPDNTGIYSDGNVFLGHKRLSIIDFSDSANQPMTSVDGRFIVVFNGEIYNFNELKNKVDYPFSTNSDTEVILALFDKYGEDFVDMLKGMFAIAIYDKSEKALWLFRDRYGKKPVYYTVSNGTFIFASEIKAITSYVGTPEFNLDAVPSYLALMACTGKETFYKNVFKLDSGSRLLYRNGKIEDERYYNILDNVYKCDDNFETASGRVRELLESSINYRLVSDAEVGMMLSGGLDSSYITSVASSIKHKGFKTFTVGFKEYEQYDETSYAAEAAKFAGAEHHEYKLDADEFYSVLDDVVYHMDEPVNDPAMVPTFILSRFIKENGIKVVLTGEGSDELFLGYDYYFDLLDSLKNGKSVTKGKPFDMFRLEYSKFRNDNGGLAYQSFAETFNDYQLGAIYKQHRSSSAIDDLRNAFDKSCLSGSTFWYSYVDFMVWIQNVLLMKLDKMSMANSVEFRAPFLDHDLVHYVFSLAEKSRLSDKYRTKALLKTAAEGIVPSSIINRRKKGFSSPFIEWFFQRGLEEEIWEFNKKMDILDKHTLEELFTSAKEGKNKLHVWGLYILSRWHSMNFGGA